LSEVSRLPLRYLDARLPVCQLVCQLLDGLADRRIGFDQRLCFSTCVQHGCMVSISKVAANLFQAVAGQLPSQEHGDAARSDDSLLPGGTAKIAGQDFEVLGYVFRNRPQLRFGAEGSALEQALADVVLVDPALGIVGYLVQLVQYAQQLGDGDRFGGRAGNALDNQIDDIVGQPGAASGNELFENLPASRIAGRFERDGQSARETAGQSGQQVGGFQRCLAQRDDDSSAALQQRIERSGQFFLSPQLVAHLVQVIQYEQRHAAHLVAQVLDGIRLQGQRVIAGEIGAGGTDDFRSTVFLAKFAGNANRQQRLARAGVAEQGDGRVARRRLAQRLDGGAHEQIVLVADVLAQGQQGSRVLSRPRRGTRTV